MTEPTAAEAPEAPEVQQPTDIVDAEVEDDPTPEQAEESKRVEVAIRRVTTDLTLDKDADPNDLTPAQIAALKSIMNFDINEQGAWPQVIAFMHVCVKRGLDPFNREVYLMARGKIGSAGRKWTIQTGIDGYLILAARTGLYVGVRDRVWTGNDDSLDAWWFDERTGIRRRIWSDFWPTSYGEPGAARVTIDHLTARGAQVATDYVADWAMYAPYFDEWKDGKKTGRKVLGEMWAKGGPMMLSKCLPGSALIPTDRGMLPIRDVVEGRLPVKVRSIDLDTGREVWKPVVNWWRNAPTKEWVRIWCPNGTRSNHAQRLTHDHPVWTPDGYVKAGEIVAGDLVAVASPVPSAAQEQVILGGLLGDAHLAGRKRVSTQPHFAVSHSTAQAGYARWTAAALASLGTTVTETTNDDGTGKRHPVILVRTRTAASLYGYRSMTPQQWLAGLGDLGLAVWLMDDGGYKGKPGQPSFAINIHCCALGAEFADDAVQWLHDRYGITTARVHRRDRNPYISIGTVESAALADRLSAYLHRSDDGAVGSKAWVAGPIEQGYAGFAFVPVTKVEHVVRAKRETRYDIEVEGTHSFVTGTGLVVSNCSVAAGLRLAIPGGLNGLYVHEELHRADADEKASQADAAKARIVQAHAAKVGRVLPTAKPGKPAEAEVEGEGLAPGEAPTGPLLDVGVPDDADAETDDTGQEPDTAEAAPDDALVRSYLIAEGQWMASLYPDRVDDADGLFARQIDAAGVTRFVELPTDDLASAVLSKRKAVAGRLAEQGMRGAEQYAAVARGEWGPSYVGPVESLLGSSAGS